MCVNEGEMMCVCAKEEAGEILSLPSGKEGSGTSGSPSQPATVPPVETRV